MFYSMVKYFVLFILSSGLAFADVNVETVSYQFLNVHGADWDGMAQTNEDWEMIRSIHEQIIEQPKILEEFYPQPNMVEYLHPIAIHSYGKLIGEGGIPLDQTSKEIFTKLTTDIAQGKGGYTNETLAALALTNSPWAVGKMRGLLTDNNLQLNEQIFRELAYVTKRFEEVEVTSENIDSDYQISQIDFRLNSKEWKEEIYQIRKASSDYLKKHPKLKTKPIFSKLMKNSHKAAELVKKELKDDNVQKQVQSILINTNLRIEPDKPKKSKMRNRTIANTKTEESSFAWIYLLIGILFFGLAFFVIRKNSNK